PHWATFGWHILFALTIVWIPVLLVVMWIRRSTHYVLTNYRFLVETGIMSKTSKSSQLDKINDVTCHQSLWGRMFGYGDIVLETVFAGSMQWMTSLQPSASKAQSIAAVAASVA